MEDISDHLTYLEHCRQKMLLALRNRQWADAAMFAGGAENTLSQLKRVFEVESKT